MTPLHLVRTLAILLLVANQSFAQSYCASNATSTADTDTENVTFNTINNNSSNCTGYSDFTGISTTVTQGNSYTLFVTTGDCDGGGVYNRGTIAYIDWNDDGDFVDAGETVMTVANGPAGTYSNLVTVPGGAAVGTTRLRVVTTEGGVSGSCGTYSWGETEDYSIIIAASGPMTYSSSTTSQNTANAQECNNNLQIIGLEVVTTGSTSPLTFTQLRMNMTGTTNIAADVSNIDIYYTGTSSSFATSNLFGSAAPAGGNFNINGSQVLATGTNYFWIAYDLTATPNLGNFLDAQCVQFTASAVNYVPTPTSPAGNRMIFICNPAPGGVSANIQSWLRADAGSGTTTDATTISTWTDDSGNSNDGTGAGATRPVYRRNAGDYVNFNPGIDFDGVNDFMDLPNNTMATSGNPYSFYVVARPSATHATGSPGKIVHAGEYFPVSSANQWVAMDVRSTRRVLHGFNQNDIWSPTNCWTENEPIEITCVHDQTSSPRRETFTHSTVNSTAVNDNPGTNHNNNGGYDMIGKASPNNEYYDGLVQEIIIYDGKHSTTDRYAVESYLSVKYGITMDHNYIAGDGSTVVWDLTANAGYNNDIAGIARDDASDLHQKQSKSENPDAVVTIGNGTSIAADNIANSNTFSTSGSWLMWGNDNGALSGQWQLNPFTTVNSEVIESVMIREWKAQETGTVGTVRIRVDMSTVPGIGGAPGNNDLQFVRLLVDGDGNFATGATSISPSTFNNTTNIIEFEHDFGAGTGFFFTVASTNYSAAPLPVTMTYFEATPVGDHVNLDWETETEFNNAYFVMERSTDLNNWDFFGQVEGFGTTTDPQYYQLIDDDPLYGTSYYRLTQYDLDGTASIPMIRSVNFTPTGPFELFPNPADKQVTLRLNNSLTGWQIRMYDLTGKLVRNETTYGSMVMEVGDLRAGTYIVEAWNGNEKLVRRLVLSH